MSDLPPNSEPTLWMITGSPSTAPSEGEKAGGIFRGGRLGGEDAENHARQIRRAIERCPHKRE